MKLIKIDDRTYINPKKIIAINLPPNPSTGQYWLSIVFDNRVSADMHFNTLEEGKRFIKELMSDER